MVCNGHLCFCWSEIFAPSRRHHVGHHDTVVFTDASGRDGRVHDQLAAVGPPGAEPDARPAPVVPPRVHLAPRHRAQRLSERGPGGRRAQRE